MSTAIDTLVSIMCCPVQQIHIQYPFDAVSIQKDLILSTWINKLKEISMRVAQWYKQ